MVQAIASLFETNNFIVYSVYGQVFFAMGLAVAFVAYAIVGGLGIAVLSLHSLVLESSGGRLALLDVQGFPIHRRWNLAYPRHRELSLVVKAFLQFAIESEPRICAQLEDARDAFRSHCPG
mgnify:CR=1 FL=1